jgi:hypothetical protein
VARKRTADDQMGPLSAGDLFAFAPGNPVPVAEGAFSVVALNTAAKQVNKVKDGGQESARRHREAGGLSSAGRQDVPGRSRGCRRLP